jgi:hypothetical protein
MGKLLKGMNIAKTVHDVVKDPNPANKAAAVVTTAVGAAGHPYLAPLAGAAAKKVVEYGMRPEVQAKAKEIGGNIAKGAANAAGAAGRGLRRGMGSVAAKVSEFKAGHGK